jgi:putative DNA primase/helicase
MDHLEQIGGEWRERSAELASWAMSHLVNRADVWGRYVRRKGDDATNVVTAPFINERGKVFLDHDSLRKHFRTQQPGGQIGLHSASPELTSRWLAIDIDLHNPDDDVSASRAGNLTAARGWHRALVEKGLDPLLMDSNGIGGFHILVVFADPMSTVRVHEFGARLIADFEHRGLDQAPEVFPGKPTWSHYSDWLRLPGRHHTRPHYTRVWNDEPFAEAPWLEGHDAINRILAARPAPAMLFEKLGISKQ